MKKIILIVTFSLCFISIYSQRVFIDDLKEIDGVYYSKENNKPYSGEIYATNNGNISWEVFCKKGLLDGRSTSYHYNGKIGTRGHYKNGKRDGEWKWYNFFNGMVYEEALYNQGNLILRKCYDDNGLRINCN